MGPNTLYKKVFTESKTEAMISVRYEELVNLMLAGQLIPGMKYRIIDYVTIFSSVVDSAEHPFDIVVTALSEDILSENCSAMQSDRDEGYFNDQNLESWQLKYTINGFEKFNGCTELCNIMLDGTWYDWVGFRRLSTGELVSLYVYGSTYYYTNIARPVYGDIVKGCTYDGDTKICTDNGTTAVVENSEDTELNNGFIYDKGFIYEMIDDKGNRAPYDFKNVLWNAGMYTFSVPTADSYLDCTVYSSVCRNNRIYSSKIAYDKVPLPYVALSNASGLIFDNTINSSYVQISGDIYGVKGNTIERDAHVEITSNGVTNCTISSMFIAEPYNGQMGTMENVKVGGYEISSVLFTVLQLVGDLRNTNIIYKTNYFYGLNTLYLLSLDGGTIIFDNKVTYMKLIPDDSKISIYIGTYNSSTQVYDWANKSIYLPTPEGA